MIPYKLICFSAIDDYKRGEITLDELVDVALRFAPEEELGSIVKRALSRKRKPKNTKTVDFPSWYRCLFLYFVREAMTQGYNKTQAIKAVREKVLKTYGPPSIHTVRKRTRPTLRTIKNWYDESQEIECPK